MVNLLSNEQTITEDQLLSGTEELKRNVIAFAFLMIGLLVGIIVIFSMFIMYSNGSITKDKMTTGIVIASIVIICSIIIPIILMIYTSYTQKLLMKSYENQQLSRDTFESPVHTERGRFIYQFQTPMAKSRLAPTISLLENVVKRIDFNNQNIEVTEDFKKDIISLLNLPDKKDMEVKMEISQEAEGDKQDSSVLETLRSIKNKFDQLKNTEGYEEEYEQLKIRLAEKNNPATIIFDAECLKKLKLISESNMCNFQIGYRNILSIKCLDDPEFSDYNYEYYIDEFGRKMVRKVFKDRLLNMSGFCYIVNGNEGDVFDFQEALSNDVMQVKVRKSTNRFKLVGWLVKDQIPLLYCMDLDNAERINSLCLGFEPLKDSTIHALIELYAKESKVNDLLRNENIFIKRNNLDLKEYVDKGVNDKFEEFLEETDVPKYLSEKVEFQKANITTLVVSILTGLLGFIIGLLI